MPVASWSWTRGCAHLLTCASCGVGSFLFGLRITAVPGDFWRPFSGFCGTRGAVAGGNGRVASVRARAIRPRRPKE